MDDDNKDIELTSEMITRIINDPNNSIGAEIARRAAKVKDGSERLYSTDEVEQMLRQAEWDERWESLSPEERRRELRAMDEHVVETDRTSLDKREDEK